MDTLPPVTVPALLARLRASDPGRPRLTWYGPGGERVELSARVLENWVAKTANLLVDELDAEPGTRVLLDLPPHWRTVVWALAAWAVGAEVVHDGPADILVSADRADSADSADSAGALQVVVALSALARCAQRVPPGAVDYAAVVAGQGDDLPPASARAVDPGATWPDGVRLLVPAGAFDLRRAVLASLAADGSVVLLGPGAPDAARVSAVERVTASM